MVVCVITLHTRVIGTIMLITTVADIIQDTPFIRALTVYKDIGGISTVLMPTANTVRRSMPQEAALGQQVPVHVPPQEPSSPKTMVHVAPISKRWQDNNKTVPASLPTPPNASHVTNLLPPVTLPATPAPVVTVKAILPTCQHLEFEGVDKIKTINQATPLPTIAIIPTTVRPADASPKGKLRKTQVIIKIPSNEAVVKTTPEIRVTAVQVLRAAPVARLHVVAVVEEELPVHVNPL